MRPNGETGVRRKIQARRMRKEDGKLAVRPRGRGTAHIAKTVPLCRRVFVENRGKASETWYLIDS